ncbi:unnamed protein product [Bemisia tabaci]|uniref:Amino acid transporter transmembrane domain-containing protein n=1 Tax=Bemisia tabaci TaxID=7038 RepID=A0A9P0F771_BEMTA|nr:unnamed protein product [Bemisia tabaci]
MTKTESKDMMSKISEAERNGSKTKIIDDKYDYDPYDQPAPENATSYADSLTILLKFSLGTGILAMPRSFHNAGYVVGFIGTMVIGFLTTYTIHMIMSAEYELCKRKRVPNMSYPETMEAAFEYGPRKMRKFKNAAWFMCYIFLLIYQTGTSCIYLVFIADNLKEELDLFFGGSTDIRMVIVYLLIPLILISMVRNLKLISPLASLGHIFVMICFSIIFYYIFRDIPNIAERKPVGTMQGIPLFFGTVLFAMEAIGSVMPVKNEMAKPEQFTSRFGVINMAMVPIVLLYTVIGLFGYLQYGDKTKGSITLNMPQHNLFGHTVKLLLAASVYINYAISNYVIYDLVWPCLTSKMEKNSHKLSYEYCVRIAIVLITFGFSIAIPNLELFISFLGSLCLVNLGIFFPVILQTLTFWDEFRGPRFYTFLIKNIFLIIIAILGFVIGVGRSSIEIYNTVILPSFS